MASVGQEVAAILNSDDGSSVRDRLHTLLAAVIDDPDGRGCFVANTVCDPNHGHAPSREATTAALDEWRTAYWGALEAAAKRGELSTECTLAIEAETLLALTEGPRVMTKADTDPTALTDVVNSVLDRILPSASLAD